MLGLENILMLNLAPEWLIIPAPQTPNASSEIPQTSTCQPSRRLMS